MFCTTHILLRPQWQRPNLLLWFLFDFRSGWCDTMCCGGRDDDGGMKRCLVWVFFVSRDKWTNSRATIWTRCVIEWNANATRQLIIKCRVHNAHPIMERHLTINVNFCFMMRNAKREICSRRKTKAYKRRGKKRCFSKWTVSIYRLSFSLALVRLVRLVHTHACFQRM